jgi:hypothetical protein
MIKTILHLHGRGFLYLMLDSELREIFTHISCFTLLDRLHGFVSSEESVDLAGSWLLEILVVFPVVLSFFLPVSSELLV